MKAGATKMAGRSAEEIRRLLLGKRITKVVLNAFRSRSSGDEMAHRPVLTLEDGTTVRFSTQETDVGEYGTALVITPPPEAPRAKGATHESDGK